MHWKLIKWKKYAFYVDIWNFHSVFCSRVDQWEQLSPLQDCLKEQDALIPLEQAARLRVSELSSLMESEKSQGSVLKAILQAKETNELKGICGRMGDLGAIDGECYV